jgi:outer membrane protein TolC
MLATLADKPRFAWPQLLLAPALLACALAAMTAPLTAQMPLSIVVDLAQRNSSAVKLAQADLLKAQAALSQTEDAYIPNFSIGSTVG